MRTNWFKFRGFTLIELLIVVAIIAILAAIAVPNFLEAQTRAKISRAKSDMRTLATALESYYVDHESYTSRNLEGDNPQSAGTSHGQPWWRGLALLTSPIAYISGIPLDGFGDSKVDNNPANRRGPGYGLGTGIANPRTQVGISANNIPTNRTDCYMLESDGPDRYDDTGGVILATSRFPFPAIADVNDLEAVLYVDFVGQPLAAHALLYDPTNGTVSGGEIARFGGVKPAGEVYEYWWNNSLK